MLNLFGGFPLFGGFSTSQDVFSFSQSLFSNSFNARFSRPRSPFANHPDSLESRLNRDLEELLSASGESLLLPPGLLGQPTVGLGSQEPQEFATTPTAGGPTSPNNPNPEPTPAPEINTTPPRPQPVIDNSGDEEISGESE